MDGEIVIRRVDNGFVVLYDDEDEDTMPITREFVFKDENGAFGELYSIQGALYKVLEYFNLEGSKHDNTRLRIELEETK